MRQFHDTMLAHNSAAFSSGHDALPVCLSEENPNRLVSLLDMLRLKAAHFVTAHSIIGQSIMDIESGRIPHQESIHVLGAHIGMLRTYCKELGLHYSIKHIDRHNESHRELSRLLSWLKELQSRMVDELDGRLFIQVHPDRAEFYEPAISEDWKEIADRFSCGFDVEEARKCLALERYTAAVFHLMRITEAAVLELQCFLDKQDPKAHFGSVLNKLDVLNRKTEFKELPEHLKAYRDFLIAILPADACGQGFVAEQGFAR